MGYENAIGIISRQNRQVTLSNQALLDNAFEGLLSLDAENRIRAYNRSAQEILLSQEIVINVGERLRLFPHHHGTDAFYAAVMERR